MSSWLRCNRCGIEVDVSAVADASSQENPLLGMGKTMSSAKLLKSWTRITATRRAGTYIASAKPAVEGFDLCEDCREVLLEQFMVGAAVAPITQPPGMNKLPHDNQPYQDCLLAFDPAKGRFICEHDDPVRFLRLQRDRAQNVAEGVPERKACRYCQCVEHLGLKCSSTGCDCLVSTDGEDLTAAYSAQEAAHPGDVDGRPERIRQLVDRLAGDVQTSGYAHARVNRCTEECSEQHTYREGCLLTGLTQQETGTGKKGKRAKVKDQPASPPLFRKDRLNPRLTSRAVVRGDGDWSDVGIVDDLHEGESAEATAEEMSGE